MVVDTRNHRVVDLGDGEALGGSGPSLQVDDTRESPLQVGVLVLTSVEVNLRVVDTREAPLEAGEDLGDQSSDCEIG